MPAPRFPIRHALTDTIGVLMLLTILAVALAFTEPDFRDATPSECHHSAC